jgi:hypothetical protein
MPVKKVEVELSDDSEVEVPVVAKNGKAGQTKVNAKTAVKKPQVDDSSDEEEEHVLLNKKTNGTKANAGTNGKKPATFTKKAADSDDDSEEVVQTKKQAVLPKAKAQVAKKVVAKQADSDDEDVKKFKLYLE